MKLRGICLASAFVVLALNTSAHAGLETNGSFETGNFIPNGQDTMSLGAGATDMTGWTVIQAELAWIGPSNPFGITASNGDYSLDLAGYHDSIPYGGVSQTIATVAGSVYYLSFDVGAHTSATSPTSAVTGSAGGLSNTYSVTAINGMLWNTFGFEFTATGPSTSISFVGANPTNVNYIGLDNVQVTFVRGVPEPSTVTLLASGAVFGVAALRRRRGNRS